MAGELASFLQTWCALRDVPVPAREADGRCFLVFDGLYEIALSQLGRSIQLEADLAPLPQRRDLAEALLERLLKLQLARAPESAAALTLSGEQRLVAVEQIASDRLENRVFEERLGGFVNTVAMFMTLLSEEATPRPPAPMQAAQFFYP
ncbi:MAG: CesT family type III secretion system chaperone [Pseudomonadota bacterium]